jgi:hypothetical protein
MLSPAGGPLQADKPPLPPLPAITLTGVENSDPLIVSLSGNKVLLSGNSGEDGPVPQAPLILSLLGKLGLPPDGLNTAIVTFMRLFSLPIDKASVEALKKEALGALLQAKKGKGAPQGRELPEAAALAAAAAHDKDAPLSAGELAEYAAWLEGGGQEKRGGERGKRFFEGLNRRQGKDGTRWISWPFEVKAEGTDLRVFVRLLIQGENGLLIADVRDASDGNAWRFVAEKIDGKDLSVKGFSGAEGKPLPGITECAAGYAGTEKADGTGFHPLPSIDKRV